MKAYLPLSIILGIGMTLFSCKSSKDSTAFSSTSDKKTEISTEPQMLASIQRTPCYGQCPIYKATFMDNGEVKYVGKHFVENVGTYSTLISAEDVRSIEESIKEFDYYSLDSLYPTLATDFPSCITEVNLYGNYKRVIDRRNPPKNLKLFEKFLDGLLEGREFKKISDDTSFD